MKASILIVDDEKDTRELMARACCLQIDVKVLAFTHRLLIQ